jgi:hypothetical protein
MLDVFGSHAPDQPNRGPVFADVGDDPESHARDEPDVRRPCNRQTGCRPLESATYEAAAF